MPSTRMAFFFITIFVYMNEQEILTGAITTLFSALIGVLIRHLEKRKLRKDGKLTDGL
jgi:hypothetical protein